MKIKYTFDNGETSEVEVSDEIGTFVLESRRKEESGNKKEHRHCYSLDAVAYEGEDFSSDDFTEKLLDYDEPENVRIHNAFSRLSDVQKRRLTMLSEGISIHEIARTESKNYATVYESVESAKKKFLKYF